MWLDVKLKTGKNREVRKIMQKCDLQVSKLIRVDYGPFSLKNVILLLILFSFNFNKSNNYKYQQISIENLKNKKLKH